MYTNAIKYLLCGGYIPRSHVTEAKLQMRMAHQYGTDIAMLASHAAFTLLLMAIWVGWQH